VGLGLSTYEEALEYLFARTTGGIRFGLERTLELLHALGDPHQRLRVFHVAGTNGKGSTVATLDALLRSKGMRVGRYTSPHLVDFRERILVDERPIPRDAVTAFVDEHGALIDRLGGTFFEVTTALAFDHLARAEVDVAVIETGLGGRLDSTNVVDPLVAGVVSIAMDHTEYLGETIEAIAGEKAGIFKSGRPAVIGAVDGSALPVLRGRAVQARASRFVELSAAATLSNVELTPHGTRFDLAIGDEEERLTTPLLGRHQAHNAAFALLMLDAAGPDWRVGLPDAAGGLAHVRLPGRFHRHGAFLFDVAHNPDGARVLAETIRLVQVPEPIVLVLCVLRDKDWRGMLDALAPLASRIVLTQAPSVPSSRAWDLENAFQYAGAVHPHVLVDASLGDALRRAEATAGTVLVTGSFHTVGDAMASLQVHPLPG
jgi:dihydrofolate synthase / folylpolyglutamate synthase